MLNRKSPATSDCHGLTFEATRSLLGQTPVLTQSSSGRCGRRDDSCGTGEESRDEPSWIRGHIHHYPRGVLSDGVSHPCHPSTGDLCRHHHPAYRDCASGRWTPWAWTCDAHHTLTETGTSFA